MYHESQSTWLALVLVLVIIVVAFFAMRREHKDTFAPYKSFPTDRCGNLGSDTCPYLGEHFRAPCKSFPTDRCGNLGSDRCPYLGEPFA